MLTVEVSWESVEVYSRDSLEVSAHLMVTLGERLHDD